MNENTMHLTLAFIGYNTKQTKANFKTFIEENKDQVKTSNLTAGSAILNDGTSIFCVFKNSTNTKDIVFDQVVISDDSRMLTKNILSDFTIKLSGRVPEEFIYIEDLIDKGEN